MSYGPESSGLRVGSTYKLGLDLYDLLGKCLLVETETKKVSEITESALYAVGYGLFLRL